MSQDEGVHLSLSCLNLPSECFQGVRIIVSAVFNGDNIFTEIGQTETIKGYVNPVFDQKIPVIVRLDCNQILKFTLYLINDINENIIEKCGEIEISLLTLLTSPGELTFPFPFLPFSSGYVHSQQTMPLLVAMASPTETGNLGTVMKFVGHSLNVENIHLSTYYFIMELISNSLENTSILLYRSENVDSDNPEWLEFTIPTSFFPNMSEWSIQISCFKFYNNGDDLLIGRFSTTFYQLLNRSKKFLLRKGFIKGKEASMELMYVESKANCLNYLNLLKTGFQMHFTVAIDFTANNGGPNAHDSLHYIHPHTSNAYMNVLSEICPNIIKFDKLDRLSLLGFGAKISPNYELSQNFALNENINNPHVKGIENVLYYYRQKAIDVMPYAPTEYSGVIHHVNKLAKASLRTSADYYFSLIILTNGRIRNIQDSIDTIVQASELPVSIFFIPIENATHPFGSSGDKFKISQLICSTLKSSKNLPLRRETVSLIANNENLNSSTSFSFLTQKIFSILSRQIVLYKLKNFM